MTIGDLDKRVSIQMKTETKDGYGAPIETWATVATVWARWIPLKASERFSASQTIAEVDGEWRIRYRRNINAGNTRIVDGMGTIYDIQPSIEMGRREWLRIYAKVVNPS